MGSGYFMNEAVLSGLKTLNIEEQKKCLEALGMDFLIDTFGYEAHEDFVTRSKEGAELVKVAMTRSFEQKFGKGYPFSVDVQEEDGKYKVSFFK